MIVRAAIVAAVLVAFWQTVVWIAQPPAFILPAPLAVVETLADRADSLARHASITGLEILLGLVFGTILGVSTALIIGSVRTAQRWLMPVLVASQAVPVFALAPILVLWLGYGLASKVAMATLIIFFPVTSAFLDGLRRTDTGWLDLARTMNASPLAVLWRIRVPAALPALASGLRVAAAVAPIGAVVGEWVGSSGGLGYLMLHANGRMQTDLMFAALVVLCALALIIFFTLDAGLRRLTRWQSETGPVAPAVPLARS